MRGSLLIALLLATALLPIACQRAVRDGGGDVSGPDEACPPVLGVPTGSGRIAIALNQRVDAGRAPAPGNDAERIVFRQLYETLVRADCCGRLRPGLAVDWRSEHNGRRWIFTLREEARFWDGAPVAAGDVRRGWAARRRAADVDEAYFPWSWIAGVSELEVDPRTVAVDLAVAVETPGIFTHPALAVTRWEGTSPWPLGSGAFRPNAEAAAERGERGGATLHFVRNPYHPQMRREGEIIAPTALRVDLHPGADPRDLLARRPDLTLVRSLRAAEFVDLLDDYLRAPLPYDRTYVVLSTPAESLDARDPQTYFQAARFEVFDPVRASLAAETMDSDATAAADLAFVPDDRYCKARPVRPARLEDCPEGLVPEQLYGQVRWVTGEDRVAYGPLRLLYDQSDPDAVRLAERLVGFWPEPAQEYFSGAEAMGWTFLRVVMNAGRDEVPLAVGVTDERLRSQALRPGGPPCILHSPHRIADDCLAACAFAARYPGRVLVPLVSTRAQLVTRRGLGGLQIDWDGTPVLSRAGWGALDVRGMGAVP